LILSRIAATDNNAINDQFSVWRQAGALRDARADDPAAGLAGNQLIGFEDATSSGVYPHPAPALRLATGSIGGAGRNQGSERSRGTRRESGGGGTKGDYHCTL